MNRTTLTMAALIAGSSLSAIASADNLKFLGDAYGGTLSGTVTFFDAGTHGHKTAKVDIGKLLFQDGSQKLTTVCADLGSVLDGNGHSYALSFTDPFAGTNLSLAGDIVEADFNKATNAESGAALQLAVWSALYNGGSSFDANGSGFKVTGVSNPVLQLATTYYQDFNVKGKALYFETSGGCGGQSQLGPSPAPEPASMAALCIGAVGLLARRKRLRA